MKIQGERTLPYPRETVWRAILDPEVLSNTLPGCKRLEATGDNSFAGTLDVSVGPIKGRFKGTLDLLDLDPRNGYRMKLDGRGPAGFMTGEGTLELADADGGTTIRYDLDAKIGGRIAGLGQRVLESSARVITEQGFEGLERQLAAARTDAAAAAADETAPPPPSQTELAAKVATGVLSDLIPPGVRPWLAVGIIAAIAILTVVVARSCG
jgi:carbon monoxide dehydrogenase subunit G